MEWCFQTARWFILTHPAQQKENEFMHFKASFYMTLNKIVGFVEPCSDDEFDAEIYWHDCKGKWIFESLFW